MNNREIVEQYRNKYGYERSLNINAIKKLKRTDEKHIDSFEGIDSAELFSRVVIPKSQYKYVYVLLDTDNKADELSGGNKIGWHFSTTGSLQAGTVNVSTNMRNLVGMRIYPIKANYDLTVGLASGHYNNFTNLNNNFTILINEFASQSFVGRDGRKFHFVLFPINMDANNSLVVDDPYYEYVTSGKGNGYFWFQKPITTFSTLTVTLANPFDEISLAKNVRTLIPIEFIFLDT